MTKDLNISNSWILALYAAVAVVALVVWRTQSGAQVPPLVSSDQEGRLSLAASMTKVMDASESTKSQAATSLADAGTSVDAILAQAAAGLAQEDPSGRDLLLESARSNDPAVRQRQQRIQLGIGASLGGLRPFDDQNAWNRVIEDAPVDPLSDTILRKIGNGRGLHPDFASAVGEFGSIGVPYVVISSAQPLVPVEFINFADQSDPGPYPIPPGLPIEGHLSADSDRHALILDRDNWKLYELARVFEGPTGWQADCGAIWDLSSNEGRPDGWTSADAAGLPIFPGLVRYDEVEAGEIRHALRFTVAKTRRAYVPPASHWASREDSPLLPPMGMRVRLKKSFDITKFPRDVQVILRCLQKYGMILADNGSNWFVTGTPDSRWDDDAMHLLHQVKGSDFEVIQMEGLVSDR